MSRPPLPSRRLLIGGALGVLALRLAVASRPAAALADPAAPRIVSIGGAVTEILYDLGLGDSIVAVDTTSLYPPEAMSSKPNVGYMRQLSAEGVLSVRPTLVIAAEGAGPPDALKLVREAGVPLVMVPEDPTEEGVLARIRATARAVDRVEQGEKLAGETSRRFADLAALRSRIREPAGALFILSMQNGRIMAGGRRTTADGILALAGARNVASAIEGYKLMTDEAIVAASPDIVVMMEHGPGGTPPADLFDEPALSQTPAGRHKRLVSMDGLYLLGFGPRTPDAARELLLALYPDLKAGRAER
ncbi:hemin ABC transporter substrate-binding protein [Enterovirga sp.]|uniref:heme/hemin ABC transporter substrate-binding protein n=1 Tax=Enterovirga sp. TaxID=2026350 RepID=UPI002C22F1AC|nr:hemin ABC transporter substrate-binding protein [Enterovirga sp.]HMO28603.1 hemin ABC transporter substrate-binding protein [Enterovirga sp.]